jgi:condensin complex subunit 3
LTPEKAFLVRVFVEHCINTKDDGRLESCLPVVTALAFKIQATYNDLLEQIQADEEVKFLDDQDEEAQEAKEEERADREFVIGEMLRLAVNLDYADEIGRRKMFGLVREWCDHVVSAASPSL